MVNCFFLMAQGVGGRRLWSVGWEDKKESWDATRVVPETLSLRPAEEGGTSKATSLPTKENFRSVPALMGD